MGEYIINVDRRCPVRKSLIVTIGVILFFLILPARPSLASDEAKYPVNDCHLHFVDFVQETDGIEALIEAMDRLGVEHTMLCGLPVTKMWDERNSRRPTYYLDDD
jgi:hypothetical protein